MQAVSAPTEAADHDLAGVDGVPLRRRGTVLVDAIHAAALDELVDRGYDALTIEGVAERAGTGKASIYRRWDSKLELVVDAVDSAMPAPIEPPDTGDLREDLLIVARHICAHMNSRPGGAVKACVGADHHSELHDAVQTRLVEPRMHLLHRVLLDGVSRGEVRPDAVTDRVVGLAPGLLYLESQKKRREITDDEVVEIVDEILLPLLRPCP